MKFRRISTNRSTKTKKSRRNRKSAGRVDSVDLRVERLEDRRMLSVGDLDPTFGEDGLVVDDFVLGKDEVIFTSAVQEDGKIVVAGKISDFVGASDEDFLVVRYNVDGTRDTTFGVNGLFRYDVSGEVGAQDRVNDIVIDPLGRIIAIGEAFPMVTGPSTRKTAAAVVRLTPDGQLDTTFGGGDGIVTTVLQVGGENITTEGNAVALQGDGKIVVAGTARASSTTGWDFAVIRYDQYGSLDTSFDDDGWLLTDFNSTPRDIHLRDDFARDIAIQSDGKIIVGGKVDPSASSTSFGEDFGLVRYNTNGSLDMTFGVGGKVQTDIKPTAFVSQESLDTVVVEADGQIVVGGSTTNSSGSVVPFDFVIARYDADGSLDTTFNRTPSNSVPGTLRIDVGSNEQAGGLALQPDADGKYVIAGFSDIPSGGNAKLVMARVWASGEMDGQLDLTFDPVGATGDFDGDNNGIIVAGLEDIDSTHENNIRFVRPTNVLFQPDGKIVVTGYIQQDTDEQDIVMFRYDSGVVTTAVDQLNDLVADVGDLGLSGGNSNALTSKLENAITNLDAGKTTAGVNKIHAFINQVNAFVNSGKLTQAEASLLVDAANAAITSAGTGGATLVMDGTSTAGNPASAQPVSQVGDLVVDTLHISLVDSIDGVSADEQAALQAAINSLNVSLSPYGVALVEVASAAEADIRVEIAAVSAAGGAADGLLGYAVAGEITILSGWDWYTGADVNAIAAGQYDFRTVVTHELGHSVGLDHSGDINSVMHDTLGTNVTRHTLTNQDLSLIAGHAEAPAALRAAGWSNSEPHAPREQVFTDWHQTWFSNQIADKRLTDGRRPIERIDGVDEIMNLWTGPGEAAQRRIAVHDYMPDHGLVVSDDRERNILTGSSSIFQTGWKKGLADDEQPGKVTDLAFARFVWNDLLDNEGDTAD